MKKITFKPDEVVPSLAVVSSLLNAKNALPILDDVRIVTKNDSLGGTFMELMTSDSNMWLQVKCNGIEADEGISICVNCKSLLQALRNLEQESVCMEINEESHTITCDYGNGHFTLPFNDSNEYPTPIVEKTDNDVTVMLDAKKMLTAIEKAGFATANDELRPVMCGVHFDFFKDCMVSVASDGQKLARYKDLTITNENDEFGFTIPNKPCHTLMGVLASIDEGNVKLVFNERCFTVNNCEFKLTARLLEYKYPDYERVIPKDNDKLATINRQAFMNALKRVVPMSNAASELVCLVFSNGNLEIMAEDIDFSTSAKENVVCDYTGDNFKIGFKGSTLITLLQNIDSEDVVIAMKEANRAGTLKESTESQDYEYTSLIMPMLLA